MFKNLIKNSLFLFFMFSMFPFGIATGQVIKIIEDDETIINKYQEYHREFVKKICRSDDQNFWKYFRDYKKEGRFIPLLEKVPSLAQLDTETLETKLPDLERKIAWIDEQILYLKHHPKLAIKDEIISIKKDIRLLLKLKEQYYFLEKQNEIRIKESKKALLKLKTDYDKLLKKIPFMLNYSFPVDYMAYRRNFEQVKNEKWGDKAKLKNKIYFERKLIEDGLLNDKELSIDHFTRALLNTIYIRLDQGQDNFLDEDLRYDFQRILLKLDDLLAPSAYKTLSLKFEKWKQQMQANLQFYKKLLADSKSGNQEFISNLVGAREVLKKFNYEKQADVYDYWLNQGELYSSLFVLETILLHEVGGLDSHDSWDRNRITQLVINRYLYNQFDYLDNNDEILAFLLKKLDLKKIQSEGRWMNILFKQGEFSFTYFFLPLSVGIYCHDMAPRAKHLRVENLSMSLKLLRSPNMNFSAIRFYSRHSMLGGLAMEKLWESYEQFPEEVASKIENKSDTEGFQKKLKTGHYLYLYPINNNLHVFDMGSNPWKKTLPYIYNKNEKKFYNYRNPQYFRYFKSSNNIVHNK